LAIGVRYAAIYTKETSAQSRRELTAVVCS
jgi:hypothetical protein